VQAVLIDIEEIKLQDKTNGVTADLVTETESRSSSEPQPSANDEFSNFMRP
jgi:hypothetical protein